MVGDDSTMSMCAELIKVIGDVGDGDKHSNLLWNTYSMQIVEYPISTIE